MSTSMIQLITPFLRKTLADGELRMLLAACQTPEEAGRVATAWLLQHDVPEKSALLQQVFALALADVNVRFVGMALGVTMGVPAIVQRAFRDMALLDRDEREDDPVESWRGNNVCARMIWLCTNRKDECGGLVWSDDLDRNGGRIPGKSVGELVYGVDYVFATLANTTAEQVTNFGDRILINEFGRDGGTRPYRALAGLLYICAGREAAHAVLLRCVQAGGLNQLYPDLYPLADDGTSLLIASSLRCSFHASDACGLPEYWQNYSINHLALAGLICDVLDEPQALACMQELERRGSMATLSPEEFGLPDALDEWNWRLETAVGK